MPKRPRSTPERDNGLFEPRNRVKAVLVAGGILAAALYLNNNRSSGEDSGSREEAVWLQPDPVEPQQVEKFDLRTYKSPEAGRIWKTHLSESSEKSIVYIPDIHQKKDNPEEWLIQGQIFAIVEDAIQKYGKVPVVIEGWTDFEDSKGNFRRNIEDERLMTIASEPDIGKRKKAAIERIQQGKGSAGSLLSAVYQDEIEPVPSQNQAEVRRDLRRAMLNKFLGNIRNENAPCSAIGVPEARMGIDSALDQSSAEAMTPELVACQCTYLTILRNSIRDLSSSRRKRAAAIEIKRGVEHKNPFIFVIAGTAHVIEAMRVMEEGNVSYVVVVPHSNDMNYAQNNKAPDIGYCEQWALDHKEELEKDKQVLEKLIARRASKLGY